MHLQKPRRCPARCLINRLLPDSYTTGQFQCSAPFPRLLLQPRGPDGALDILVSVTSGTSGLLSGRPLLRKWIKWIGQPKTVSPEFYESSLSKIYPSGHWLGCDSVILGKGLFNSTEHDCRGSGGPQKQDRAQHGTFPAMKRRFPGGSAQPPPRG